MTLCDKELLELAAKAAGYDYAKFGWYIVVDGIPVNWNPLTDDGDALRLAVKLEIAVRYFDGEANAFGRDLEDHYEYGNDPYAATRRAIVRAAAEIGKEME